MWTTGLAGWYALHGRHSLPWRRTRDRWAVLMSEVMLQQTAVARVQPRWEVFMERWPQPHAFAAAPLDDVLRAWQGLGYPRRALALHRCAGMIAADGWPEDEQGLRALPGIGVYTARALLTLACETESAVPCDVNITRVARRAAFGSSAAGPAPREVTEAVAAARPPAMTPRDYTLSLFDVGAMHCRAVPRCAGCPLAAHCGHKARGDTAGASRPRKQPAYRGSFRAARGAVLAVMLEEPAPAERAALQDRVRAHPPAVVSAALESLVRDGLLRSDLLISR